MKSFILDEVLKLKDKPHVDQKILEKFIRRISSNQPYVKSQSLKDHFGSFLLPVNKKNRKAYLGYHLKANTWLPPGGHIEDGETPESAMRREFFEELGYKLQDETVELFNLSIPYYQGHQHYDFWYLIYTDLIDFKFDPKEFREAKWIEIKDMFSYMKRDDYAPVVEELRKYFN